VSSTFVGHDEYGHPRFDTERTEIGELLYRLKNRSDEGVVGEIADTAVRFLESWNPGADIIVPVPPSRNRAKQPVFVLADALSSRLEIPVKWDAVERTREVPELKNVYELKERLRLLAGAHTGKARVVSGKKALLFDDLFRSGATMNAVTEALYDAGAKDVFAFTITRTRSKS
jgi:competence protein ComFC